VSHGLNLGLPGNGVRSIRLNGFTFGVEFANIVELTDAPVSQILARLSQGGMATLPDGKVTYPSV
jgi:hypothetical protein